MQKKSTSQSAFFQLRAVAGLFVLLSGVFLALVSLGSFSTLFAQATSARAEAPAPAPEGAQAEKLSPADKEGRFVYLIEFSEAGLLQRQTPGSGENFDPNAAETRTQQAQIEAEQASHIQALDSAVGRSINPTHRYVATHSGIAARLTPAEADIVRSYPAVKSVERERVYEPDTYRGPDFIGATSIWNGTAVPGGVGSRGNGLVIGVLDTGIVQSHPSFANDPNCGHGQSGAPNKLISALDCSSATGPGGVCNGPNPEDSNGHGTHTAGTAGGNVLGPTANPPPTPPSGFTQISGVAPCANIRAYKVCPTNCPSADIQAGMNSILLHGDVQVMNFSISGGNNPWNDNDRRKLDLVDANIIVAASAGNTNATITDPVSNVAHLGPWVMTVAASTHDGDLEARLSATGPGTPPEQTQNLPAARGSGSPLGQALTNFPIRRFPGQDPAAEGCNASTPFPAGYFANAAALIKRGGCTFTEKITNAFNAGAQLVIIFNNTNLEFAMSTPGQPNVPAYSIGGSSGTVLANFIEANGNTATINFDPQVPIPGDILATFSLRGPSRIPSLTKPDITAPGVNIYAPYVGASGYAFLSGTSMSSPHAAGAATLVRAVRPTWTAPEVKSALMMTAKKTGVKNDRITQWDADDVGNGRTDLTKAARAGLVMHETSLSFLNANPATGGDPKTLNLPSMRNLECAPHCVFKRTVRNTLSTASTWNVSGASLDGSGYNVTVSPSNFSFTGTPLETEEITITVVPTSNTATGPVRFGEVVLTETGGQSPPLHMTLAIKGEQFVVGAVSRKSHGSAGDFDIPLPLLGTPGIESRIGAIAGNHQIVITFTAPVTLTGAQVTEGTGTATFVPMGSSVVVNLVGVTDIQRLAVTLTGVTNGTTTANVRIPMGVLAGDSNGSGTVSASDLSQVKAATSPGSVNASNFRADFDANGAITSSDVSTVKSRSGNMLP